MPLGRVVPLDVVLQRCITLTGDIFEIGRGQLPWKVGLGNQVHVAGNILLVSGGCMLAITRKTGMQFTIPAETTIPSDNDLVVESRALISLTFARNK